jgi:hypothetical protein
MSGTKGNTYLQAIIPQLEHLARLLCLDGMCETEFLLSTDLRRAQTRTEKQNKQKKLKINGNGNNYSSILTQFSMC